MPENRPQAGDIWTYNRPHFPSDYRIISVEIDTGIAHLQAISDGLSAFYKLSAFTNNKLWLLKQRTPRLEEVGIQEENEMIVI